MLLLLLSACGQKRQEPVVTPWGEITDTIPTDEDFDLADIQRNGELIALTLTGHETYYDYRGKHLGTHYLLCQRFADQLGVSLRMEVCRDTAEMRQRLKNGEADIAILPPSSSPAQQLRLRGLPAGSPSAPAEKMRLRGFPAGSPSSPAEKMRLRGFPAGSASSRLDNWLVGPDKENLRIELKKWYRPSMLAEVKKQEEYLLSSRSVKRRVFSPMLNSASGIISHYDAYFQRYASQIRWDWRLLAAQCYQESTFDPQARSWAGACGLMQIMPSTADHLGLDRSQIYDPEKNIAAAVKYIAELEQSFSDIRERSERTKFVLAAYNGGGFHIRDAMALARKHGRNATLWRDVEPYVLGLSRAEYYNDPVVRNGYMRGSETVDYVRRIHERWNGYRGVKTVHMVAGPTGIPQKAKRERKKKYQIVDNSQ